MIGTFCAIWRLAFAATLALGLSPAAVQASPEVGHEIVATGVALASAEAKRKQARGERVWCVPFARTATGVQIKGNAKTWWAAAEGRYDRGSEPRVGAVMAFAGSSKMPMGHVAVVSRVVSEREILIDHANWKRNRISLGMRAVDVSDANDWSAVRVEGDPGVLGRVNPVNGFIYPAQPERMALQDRVKTRKDRKARKDRTRVETVSFR